MVLYVTLSLSHFHCFSNQVGDFSSLKLEAPGLSNSGAYVHLCVCASDRLFFFMHVWAFLCGGCHVWRLFLDFKVVELGQRIKLCLFVRPKCECEYILWCTAMVNKVSIDSSLSLWCVFSLHLHLYILLVFCLFLLPPSSCWPSCSLRRGLAKGGPE